MKKIMLLLVGVLSLTNMAMANCQYEAEAQVQAKIVKKETDSLTYCKVQIGQVQSYSANPLCPLSLDEILYTGVSLPLTNGHDCDYSVGDTISGVMVLKNNKIFID